jgi:hypothetical protein
VRAELLAQQDATVGCIQIPQLENERAAAPAGGLQVKPEQQGVESWVQAAGANGVDDVADLGGAEAVACAGQSSGQRCQGCRISYRVEQTVCGGEPAQVAHRTSGVFAGVAATAVRSPLCGGPGRVALQGKDV